MDIDATLAILTKADPGIFWTVKVQTIFKHDNDSCNGCNTQLDGLLNAISGVGRFNSFNGPKIAKSLRKLAYKQACEISFGMEYSPVLYIRPFHRKDLPAFKDDIFAVKLAMKTLKADEIGGDEVVRAWWD